MVQALSSQHTQSFPDFLAQTGISVMVSTYQAGKLILLRNEKGVLNTHFDAMAKPMGIALQDAHLAVGTGSQISHYYNMADVGAKVAPVNTHNGCYVPRETHITGDIDIHEMGFAADKELWLVNTRMSCLCTISPEYSVVPRWRPPFISAYDLTDRCHLNGLAMKDGEPRYVSALGTTDSAAGWRKDKAFGGMLMDIRDNRMITSGLSMPHSPRWYQDKLYVLESGAGSLATVDLDTGKLTTVIELPGFTRGIDFIGRYAFIGLSQVRETNVFGGLPLTERCQERQCGVYIVDIIEPKVVGFVTFAGEVNEIFSIQIIPASFPTILPMDDPLLRSTYSIPQEALNAFSAPDPLQKALEEANVFYSRRQFDEAIKTYQKLLKSSPDNVIARQNLGMSYVESKQWKKAVGAFNKVLKIDAKHVDAKLNCGKAFMGLRDWEKAMTSFDDALTADQQFSAAQYQRALVLLHQGEYKEAWTALEWRWKLPENTPLDCVQSQWQGEDISNKTLLVHTEKDIADTLFFTRFLPQLVGVCKKLVVVCPESLRLLFQAIDGVDEVRTPETNKGLKFDVFLPIMSIPSMLEVSAESIDTELPKLNLTKEIVVSTLAENKSLKVALIWRDHVDERDNKDLTVKLESYLPLLKSKNVEFYSMQDAHTDEEQHWLEKHSIKILDSEMVSYAHSAALLKQFDLLIGKDTAITRLSAALGIPTWLVLDCNSSWIWEDKGDTSRWYSMARVFRESKHKSVKSLFSNVAQQLKSLPKK